MPLPDGEPAPADPVATPGAAISAFLNGAEAAVESAQFVPGEVGVAEVRIRIPADAGPTEKSLVIRAGAAESSPRVVQVQ